MSAGELKEHARYLGDAVKLDAYDRALRSVLSTGDEVVLDLGAGTGILGLLAARAGARKVYAVDSGSILGPAEEIARRTTVADRFEHIRGRSTEIDLPERADVAVCDQIGGLVHDAGVLRYFADAKARLLAADAVLVPRRFRLFLAPARCDLVRSQIDLWGSGPAGFDLTPLQDAAINTEHYVEDADVAVTTAGAQIAGIDADHTGSITGGAEIQIDAAQTIDGLVGWFEADMGGGAQLTNRPGFEGRMDRWCNFYPLSERREVEAGEHVAFSIDVRPHIPAVSWTFEMGRGEAAGRDSRERRSTLLGQFLDPDDLRRRRGAPLRASRRAHLLMLALQALDGERSAGAVVEHLSSQLPPDALGAAEVRALEEDLVRFTHIARDRPAGAALRDEAHGGR
jgi:hypothetical protein